jgi:hypothetical protein
MNTRAQIVEAFSDYNAGLFGPILSSSSTPSEQDLIRNQMG